MLEYMSLTCSSIHVELHTFEFQRFGCAITDLSLKSWATLALLYWSCPVKLVYFVASCGSLENDTVLSRSVRGPFEASVRQFSVHSHRTPGGTGQTSLARAWRLGVWSSCGGGEDCEVETG